MIWQCGKYKLDVSHKPLVMGILNVTPDSFSDGGRYLDPKIAVEQGLRMAEEGADIIDVGGESTRPGAGAVRARDEAARVVPVIRALAARVRIPISVDTYKTEVARAALDAGASIVNDISAFRFDPTMARLIASSGAGAVLMHIKGRPRTMQRQPAYRDVVAEIDAYFAKRVDAAVGAGIAPAQLALDPGIGFGKTPRHNLSILKHLGRFLGHGRPLVVGASRKSFIGSLNGGIGPRERLPGSLAAALAAAAAGAAVLRVHDVPQTRQAINTFFAVTEAS